MKNSLASLFILCLITSNVLARVKNLRPKAIGVSFLLNDFTTAQRIRNGSLDNVLREKKWAKFSEMSPGLAVTYFKGLKNHIDFAGTLAACYVNYPIPDKPAFGSESLLLEGDASINLKMLGENYWVTPYLIAGIGASKFKGYYGAFIPLGVGVKLNIFDEASVFVASQYRVPVTTSTVNYHFMYSIGVSGVIGKEQ